MSRFFDDLSKPVILCFQIFRWRLKYRMDSTDLAVFKPDFDSARVERGTGEDVFDNPFCEAPGALVFLQDDRNRKAGVDVFSVLAVHAKGFSTVSVSAKLRVPVPGGYH